MDEYGRFVALMGNFIDWTDIFNTMEGAKCRGVFVLSRRSRGKTFGYRKKVLETIVKRHRLNQKGKCFLEICRYDDEVSDVADAYFDKIQADGYFQDVEFSTRNSKVYAKNLLGDNEKVCVGYVAALTKKLKGKKVGFADVGYTSFDEAIIDWDDEYHHYLRNEPKKLQTMLVTAWREVRGVSNPGRLVLMGNAVDLTCPHFATLGKSLDVTRYGKQWVRDGGRLWLFYNVPDDDTDGGKSESTNVSSLFPDYGDSTYSNKFIQDNGFQVAKHPANAKYWFAFAVDGVGYRVWRAPDGECYIDNGVPDSSGRVITFRLSDVVGAYDTVQGNVTLVHSIVMLYYSKKLWFASDDCRERFLQVLRVLGVR